MSMWYQWFMPAPITIMDLPRVLCAFSANCRATVMTRSLGTPVMRSCQAGV